MRILISGAAGFFGRALVRAFGRMGYDVVASDAGDAAAFEPRPGSGGSVQYLQLDVTDRSAFDKRRIGKLDGIVCAAALTMTPGQMIAKPDRLLAVNLTGMINTLEAARVQGCSKFLFISSAGVYDQLTASTVCEKSVLEATDLYGSAKLASEMILRQYGRAYSMDVGAVRPSWMYGPGEELRNSRTFVTAVRALVQCALSGVPVRILHPQHRRDWVYVDDVAETACRFFSTGMNGKVFNLLSGIAQEFANVVAAVRLTGGLRVENFAEVHVDGGPDLPTLISSQRARSELGFSPRGLIDGIAAYMAEPPSGAFAPERA